MADVAEETVNVAEEKQEENAVETTTNGEENVDTAPTEVKDEAAETNGDTAKEEPEKATKDTTDEVKEEDIKKEESGSRSPDQKRKDPPLSAHERQDRKRSRYNTKINSRFEDLPESSDADEIRRQVEFYFSDSNLPIDAFLLSQTGGYRNYPVDLHAIHSFKRMRHFKPFSAVRDAVAASKFLNLSDKDEITRKTPLDEKFSDDANDNRSKVHSSSMSRSIYAKGFGEEKESTHLDIENFFAPYGPINSVRLRRSDEGLFKGSVFVEFQDEETQKRFLDLDPKPQWDDKDLEIMDKQEYVDLKHQGIHDGLVKPRSPGRRPNFSRGGDRGGYRGRGRGRDYDNDRRGSSDRYDKDDWKSRRDRDQGRRGGRRDNDRGGRGRGGRGGRGGRRGRSRSPDDRKSRRRDYDDEGDNEDGGVKLEGEERAVGGAEKEVGEKRGREEDGDGEEKGFKKVKEDQGVEVGAEA